MIESVTIFSADPIVEESLSETPDGSLFILCEVGDRDR